MDPIARPTKEVLARYAEAFNRSKTLQYFGVRIDFPNADRVVASIEQIRPEQRGGLGTSAGNGRAAGGRFPVGSGFPPAPLPTPPPPRPGPPVLSLVGTPQLRSRRAEEPNA